MALIRIDWAGKIEQVLNAGLFWHLAELRPEHRMLSRLPLLYLLDFGLLLVKYGVVMQASKSPPTVISTCSRAASDSGARPCEAVLVLKSSSSIAKAITLSVRLK